MKIVLIAWLYVKEIKWYQQKKILFMHKKIIPEQI